MTDDADAEDVDVIVLGCGPSGLSLAVLLTGLGVRVAAVDKHRLVVPYPRATHIDDETLRIFQALGVADETAPELTESGEFTIYDGDWRPMIEVRAPHHRSQTTEQGWKRDYMFQQPDFESRLRGRLVTSPLASTWFGWEAGEPRQHANGVEVNLESRDGLGRRRLRGKWVVGADGAQSTVRAAMGVNMLDLNGSQRSLIMDIFPFRPDHPLADRFSFIYCAPGSNPLTYVRTAKPRARFEIMLRERDKEAPFLDHRYHHHIVERWFRPDEYRIERADLYRWRSVLACEWRRGRMLLLGDAAHEMPPMLGQGLCTGLRDAANLAWKLARVVQGSSPETLLDTYGAERGPHVREHIETAAKIANQVEAWADDPPSAARGPGQGTIERSRPRLGPGLTELAGSWAGALAPQPAMADGRLMDDVAGYRFVLLAEQSTLDKLSHESRMTLSELDCRILPAYREASSWLHQLESIAALIRPDRYLYGLARTTNELPVLIEQLRLSLIAELSTVPSCQNWGSSAQGPHM